ncbi:MAG: VWA domain-containing protein [Bryobacteraceae bacterium]
MQSRFPRWSFALAAASISIPLALWAQQEEIDVPLIRTGVTEVVVPVTVTDADNRFVSNLKQSDFEIYDQNIRQNIKFFTAEHNQPVVVGFLMDLSNSMKIRWKEYHETAVEMVLSLLPGDPKYQGYLIGYGTEAEVMVNTTYDADKIVAKLDKVTPAGGAALYDAIYLACTSRKLVKGEPVEPRRVVVIVGDGHDNASHHTLDEVIELAQRSQLTIYAISTDAYGLTSPFKKNLVRLAEETGGRVETPLEDTYDNTQGFLSRPSDEGAFEFKVGTGGFQAKILGSMFKSITAIAGEVTTQYILRYQPNTPGDESQKHEIKVRVNLANAKVRARSFYYVANP